MGFFRVTPINWPVATVSCWALQLRRWYTVRDKPFVDTSGAPQRKLVAAFPGALMGISETHDFHRYSRSVSQDICVHLEYVELPAIGVTQRVGNRFFCSWTARLEKNHLQITGCMRDQTERHGDHDTYDARCPIRDSFSGSWSLRAHSPQLPVLLVPQARFRELMA